MKTKDLEKTFTINKKVEVRPIPRNGTLFDDAVALFKGAQVKFDLPIDPDRRQRLNIFNSKEEQSFFESEFNLAPGSMSIYDRNNKFWNEYVVTVTDEGLVLNLNNVSDLLKYKVLKANDNRIAPSWLSRNDDARYRFAFIEEGDLNIEINKVQDKKKAAYTFMSQIENSVDKMIDVLNILGKKIDRTKGVNIDFLKAEIYKIIEDTTKLGEHSQLDRFVELSKDKDFEYRVLIDKALQARAIKKMGKNGYALFNGDEAVADDTREMIDWLKHPKNDVKVNTIKAQIETYFK